MVTLKVNIENEVYANMFAEMFANFTFVKSVEIPAQSKNYEAIKKPDEVLVLPAKKQGNPSEFCGLWAEKGIFDVKKFRTDLWQRS